jgi:hypothetical protein
MSNYPSTALYGWLACSLLTSPTHYSSVTSASGSRTIHCTATHRLIPSCRGELRLSAAFVTYYRSQLSNPSKDCLTPSKTSTRYFFWP